MAALKTKPTGEDVKAFINAIEPEDKRTDCLQLLKIMTKVSGYKPEIWGNGTIGFGRFKYNQKGGQEGEWYRIGFSPRKQNVTVYIMSGFSKYPELMQELGKYKTSGSCLHINKLADVNQDSLEQLMKECLVFMDKQYPK